VGGSGSGMGGKSDGGLCYLYRKVSGDQTITARLSGVNGMWEAGYGWGAPARVGIMIREALDPQARTFVMKLGDAGARQAGFGFRAKPGENMQWANGNDYTWLPAWFRLERKGDTITAYESSNGDYWFKVGESTCNLPDAYLIGFAISSDGEKVNTAHFDNTSITSGPGKGTVLPPQAITTLSLATTGTTAAVTTTTGSTAISDTKSPDPNKPDITRGMKR